MFRSLCSALLCVAIISCAACARASQFVDAPYQLHDPLLWGHLVVKGKVIAIREFASRTDEWGITVVGGPVTLAAENVTLDVEEVLRGKFDAKQIDIAMLKSQRSPTQTPFTNGDEVILAVNFNPTAKQYLLSNYRGILIANGSDWERPDPATYQYRIDKRRLKLPEIEARVTSMRPENISEQAEIVVIGKMRSVEKRRDNDGPTERTVYTMEVTSVLKGNYDKPSIQFSMVTSGKFPDWAVPIPDGVSSGESWFVFLTRKGESLIPFAGPNGMLKVVGDRLIYDQTLDYPISRSGLANIVRAGGGSPHD